MLLPTSKSEWERRLNKQLCIAVISCPLKHSKRKQDTPSNRKPLKLLRLSNLGTNSKSSKCINKVYRSHLTTKAVLLRHLTCNIITPANWLPKWIAKPRKPQITKTCNCRRSTTLSRHFRQLQSVTAGTPWNLRSNCKLNWCTCRKY